MDAKLIIRCPYFVVGNPQPRYRVFMIARFDDTNQSIQQIADKLATNGRYDLKNVSGVELFSDFVDHIDDIEGAASLLLSTIEEKSSLTLHKFEPGKAIWKLEIGAQEIQFSPELRVHVHVRCPLLPAEYKDETLDLIFEFQDPENPPGVFDINSQKMESDNFKDIKYDRKKARLDDIFKNFDFVEDQERRLPLLFGFEDFRTGPPPDGDSQWIVGFGPIRKETTGEILNKFGVKVSYWCVPSGETIPKHPGWGKTEDSATTLWPFDIAPVGNRITVDGEERKDLVMFPACSSKNVYERWEQKQSGWLLRAYSTYDASLQDADDNVLSFTPLGAWNKLVAAPHYDSLATVRGGTPGSVVPRFKGQTDATVSHTWALHYEVLDTEAADAEFKFEQFEIYFRDLLLHGVAPAGSALEVRALLDKFLDHAAEPISRVFRLTQLADKQKVEHPDHDAWLMALEVVDITPINQSDQQSRVGALNLTFALRGGQANPGPKDAEDPLHLAASIQRFKGLNAAGANSNQRIKRLPTVSARLWLMLAGINPGGQDPLPLEATDPEEKLPSTIIIPALSSSAPQWTIAGPFIMEAVERSGREIDQSLSLNLERLPGTGNDKEPLVREVDFVVIDQNPFLVARVKTDLNFGQEIGNWQTEAPEGAAWELLDTGKGFDLILPPQAVGEEFIKDHNAYTNDELKHPLFYKFSPVSAFKLFRSIRKKSFTEAPWNLRRLLGYLGGDLPGALVGHLKFELLYGLTTTIKADSLRLAEVNARLGRLPRLLDQTPPFKIENNGANDPFEKAYADLCKQYQKQLELLRTRLALLQPWSETQQERILSLDRGVTYHFRSTRIVVHPTDPTKSEGPFHPYPREEGLRGGVDWGFESTNIHNEVLTSNNGVSVSGKIVDPSFTSLGGNGFQKAGFANDKSTIYSNTFLGRAFFYSLQRIGRIGVLWNTAKHVIIYERSVIHSQQFKDDTRRWLGHPVVRKLEEYVEILQPERNYPEFGEAPKVCGFVLGDKFPPEKIYVDSKWGRDIPGGWIIPLYNPAADHDFYKEPDIHLKLATSAATDTKQTWARITNPENLYFYTSTDPSTGTDTDAWPPVPDVDFPLYNLPTVPDVPTQIQGAPDAMLPDAPATEAGYGRFTWRVNTGGKTANLLAGRQSGATEALIENVSMVRRSLRTWTPDLSNEGRRRMEGVLTDGADFRRTVEDNLAKVVGTIQQRDAAQILAEINNFKNNVQAKLASVNSQYQSLINQVSSAPLKTLTKFENAQAALKERWNNAWEETKRKVVERLIGEIQGAADRTQVDRILADIERQIYSAESALNESRETIFRLIDLLNSGGRELNALRARVEFQVIAAIEKARASQLAGNAAQLTEDLRRYYETAINSLQQLQQGVLAIKNRLGPYFPGVWAQFDTRVRALLNELLTEDLQNLQQWKQRIKDALNNYEGLITDARSNIQGALDRLNAQEFFQGYKRLLDAEAAKIQPLGDNLTQLLQDHKYQEVRRVVESKMSEVRASLERVASASDLGGFFTQASNTIGKVEQQLKTIYGNIQDVVATANREVEFARKLAEETLNKISALPAQFQNELRRAYSDLASSALASATDALAPYERLIRDEARRIDATVKDATQQLQQFGEKTLRTVRAHGLAPVAEAMRLNRERLGYYFNAARDVVDMTPATVLVNRVGQELDKLNIKSLGIRLPSRSVAEQFISDNLPKFNLRDILPDFAGINLERLFAGVGIPSYASDSVKVTHGINRETKTAWAHCDVLLPLSSDASIFNIGPVEVRLIRPNFEAHSHISIDANGKVERRVEAAIRGDWHLIILGQAVLMLVDCTLHYNSSGKINFDLKPSSIRLPQALKFLTDLVSSFKPGKASGLSFEMVLANNFPVGIRAVLNLSMPPLQTGAFAVSHIALRSRFELAAPNGKFYLAVGFGISSKERPFTLTILCLGGGGWIEALAEYYPFDGRLIGRLSIGLTAGADFAFDIGVASGGVYFLVSLYAEFSVGGGGGLRIALRVSVGGEVVVLGFISVGINLTLEASYESGGSLRCTGQLTLSIEICWCFTLEVDAHVEFVLAGGGGGGGRSTAFAEIDEPHADYVSDAVDNYMTAFGA